jgi:2-polyprenyl-3-methyl-5-hydroxy-6-metoxy-1,4-benzoquinol methylase
MTEETYCIRPDYRPNRLDTTRETGDVQYWTERRLSLSKLYQRGVYLWARRIVEARSIRNVLDVGCGPGAKTLEILAPVCEVYGIDQPSAVRVAAAASGRGRFLADDITSPVFPFARRFDFLICCDVIEHVPDPDCVIDYIRHCAAPGALILISTPDRVRLRGPDCRHSPKKEHIREWSTTEFVSYLRSRRLKPIAHRYSSQIAFSVHFAGYFFHDLLRQVLAGRPFNYNLAVLCEIDT